MRVLLAILLLFLLTACQSETSPPGAAATAADADDQGAQASAEGAGVEARRTDHYELRITQPELDPGYLPLLREVSLYTARTRDEFLGQVEAAKAEGFEFDLPWTLELELRTALDTEHLVAVVASGYQFQGGAHGMPLQGSFVYLVERRQVMTIGDWFVDDSVWGAVSAASIASLGAELAPAMGEHDDASEEALDAESEQWLTEGAGPEAHNFHLYLPQLDKQGKISGFEIQFAPYQVASYAAGTPTAVVPADTLKPFVKPELLEFFQ